MRFRVVVVRLVDARDAGEAAERALKGEGRVVRVESAEDPGVVVLDDEG